MEIEEALADWFRSESHKSKNPFPAEDFNVWSQQKIWPAVDAQWGMEWLGDLTPSNEMVSFGGLGFGCHWNLCMSHHVTLEMHVFSKLATDQRDFYSLFSNDRDCMRLALGDVRAVFAFFRLLFLLHGQNSQDEREGNNRQRKPQIAHAFHRLSQLSNSAKQFEDH